MKQTIALILLACFIQFYNDTSKNLYLKIYYGKKVIKKIKMDNGSYMIRTTKLPTPAMGKKFIIHWYTIDPRTGARNDLRKNIVTCGESAKLFEVILPKGVKNENSKNVTNNNNNVSVIRVLRPSKQDKGSQRSW